VKSRPYYTILC